MTRYLTATLFLLAACGDAGPKLDAPVVTTLANGAVEVKNSGPSGWADTTGWKLVEVYRVGGADAEGTPSELVDPQSIALDAAGGLYVADQKPAVIKQFAPGGGYLRSFGREGGGPGEFQVAFIASGPGVLALHDPRSSRTSVFDSAGNFIRSWPSSCCYWSPIMVSNTEPKDNYYIRYRLDGTVVDTMVILGPDRSGDDKYWTLSGGSGQNKMTMMMAIPLAPEVRTPLDPGGGAVITWTGEYRFWATSTGRDTTEVVTLAVSPASVSDERRLHIRDSMVAMYEKQFDRKAVEEAFKVSDIPSTAPAIRWLRVDGMRNRWVLPDDGGSSANARFDVFDSTGAYLGAVPVPATFGTYWQTAWGKDQVATVAEDEDGLPVVVVYRIERTTGGRK